MHPDREAYLVNRNVLSRRVLAGVALAALALTGCASNDNSTEPGSNSGGDSAYANLSGELKASGASFPTRTTKRSSRPSRVRPAR